MSKKDAAVYLKAAEIESEQHWFSCQAIEWALGRNRNESITGWSALSTRYANIFKPHQDTYAHSTWGHQWAEDQHECRILALCFAAAMAKAGDL